MNEIVQVRLTALVGIACAMLGCAHEEASHAGSGDPQTASASTPLTPDDDTNLSEVRGSIPKESIRGVVHAHASNIRACYEAGLAQGSRLAGKITMGWMIGPAGDVIEPHVVDSQVNSSLVEGCITKEIGTWKFPKPTGGGKVIVKFPFVFREVK